MALMDAQPYDPTRDKRRRVVIIVVILILILIGGISWKLRFWPEERVANKFFSAIEHKNYERAYGIWMADPSWKQHPQKYGRYPFATFYEDWGPASEYGTITSHQIEGAGYPQTGPGNGVVVTVRINGRPVTATVWVSKNDKSMSFPP
jgi:hypothetical protein